MARLAAFAECGVWPPGGTKIALVCATEIGFAISVVCKPTPTYVAGSAAPALPNPATLPPSKMRNPLRTLNPNRRAP